MLARVGPISAEFEKLRQTPVAHRPTRAIFGRVRSVEVDLGAGLRWPTTLPWPPCRLRACILVHICRLRHERRRNRHHNHLRLAFLGATRHIIRTRHHKPSNHITHFCASWLLRAAFGFGPTLSWRSAFLPCMFDKVLISTLFRCLRFCLDLHCLEATFRPHFDMLATQHHLTMVRACADLARQRVDLASAL